MFSDFCRWRTLPVGVTEEKEDDSDDDIRITATTRRHFQATNSAFHAPANSRLRKWVTLKQRLRNFVGNAWVVSLCTPDKAMIKETTSDNHKR